MDDEPPQTVAEFLDRWLAAVRPTLRPSTWVRYEQYARLHAARELGDLPLSQVGPTHLHALYADRLAAGCSPTSVRHLHRFLHRVFAHAVRWGDVADNPVERVDPPRPSVPPFTALSAEQARRLIDGSRGERLHALYVLALTTGLRQGELFALRWSDIDLTVRRLAVRGTLYRGAGGGWTVGAPKTRRSQRQVALAAIAVDALEAHRSAQCAERAAAGTRWEDIDIIFANRLGRPLSSQNVMARNFRPLLRRLGLPPIRFHDLRHTAATLLLGAGVHPKIVSEMLGHTSVGVTLDLYSHVTPVMHEVAVQELGRLLADRGDVD